MGADVLDRGSLLGLHRHHQGQPDVSDRPGPSCLRRQSPSWHLASPEQTSHEKGLDQGPGGASETRP